MFVCHFQAIIYIPIVVGANMDLRLMLSSSVRFIFLFRFDEKIFFSWVYTLQSVSVFLDIA